MSGIEYTAQVGDCVLHPMLQEHRHSLLCSCWFKWFKSTYMPFIFRLIYYALIQIDLLHFGQVPVPPICFAPLHTQVWLFSPIFSSAIILGPEKWTLCSSFRNLHPILVYRPLGSLMVLALLVAYFSMTFINLAAPPPWGSFGFLNFFVVTDEGLLIGVQITCPFDSVLQPSCFDPQAT